MTCVDCVASALRFGVGSDEEDATAANCERGSHWAGIVDGVDLSVDENEIGRRLRSEHRWCERGERKVGWEMFHAPEFAV